MRLKLIKVGNSWNVRVPMKVAAPFIEAGEIEVSFGERAIEVNPATGEVIGEMGKEEKLKALRSLIEMTSMKHEVSEAPKVEEPDGEVYVDEEIPVEDYFHQ